MKNILVFTLLFSSTLCSYGQKDILTSDKIISSLKAFSKNHQNETVYLHYDKPYYAAGDTIYFKAYITTSFGHQLSSLSGILHVDFINPSNKITKSFKLPVKNGVTWGDISLPDSLESGNYSIRAYTQYMLNEGSDNCFEKSIAIGSLYNAGRNKSKHTGVENLKPDFQFFPEGGSLVDGIKCKIAFKALATNGLGINVQGEVFSGNQKITSFESTHLGMGYFNFVPQPRHNYTAKLLYSNGLKDSVDLPVSKASGMTLSVVDSLRKYTVFINSNKLYFAENENNEIFLTLYEGGKATVVHSKIDSQVVKFDIQKRNLHSGILQLTLFSQSQPMSERLVFVQSSADLLNLDVSPDKPAYKKREKVNINIAAKNNVDTAVAGSFSIAVINQNILPSNDNDECTILNYLLLTSELRGYIEQPNYYFNNVTPETQAGLDLVCLTHGYRRFEWRNVFDDKYSRSVEAEKTLEISGIAKSLLGKPVKNGQVSLISSQGGPVLTVTTNNNGDFHFNNLFFTDTARFILQAINSKGGNHTKLIYYSYKPPSVKLHLPTNDSNVFTTANSNILSVQKEKLFYQNATTHVLKEVKITGVRKNENYRTQSFAGAGHADQVLHGKEIGDGPLASSLNGRLRGVVFIGEIPYLEASFMDHLSGNAKRMLVIVDGMYGVKLDFSASDVETVEVLKYASASIYGVEGAGGVLIITTKINAGKEAKDISSIGILPISVFGFYQAREFYSPKYLAVDSQSKPKDLRSTLYWKPDAVSDKNGNFKIQFYNGDLKGVCRVIVEGIDANGNLGRKVVHYEIME